MRERDHRHFHSKYSTQLREAPTPTLTPISASGAPFCFPAPKWARGTSDPEIGGAQSYLLRGFCGGCGLPHIQACLCSCIQTPSTWTLTLGSRPQPGPPFPTFPASLAYSACHLPGKDGQTQQSKITPTIAHIVQLLTLHRTCPVSLELQGGFQITATVLLSRQGS